MKIISMVGKPQKPHKAPNKARKQQLFHLKGHKMKVKDSIYKDIPLLNGKDAETRARATLQKLWLTGMVKDYETTNSTPDRLLYDWLVKAGADDSAVHRCGFRLLRHESGLTGSERIACGPGDFGNHWFDHPRVLRQKADGRLFILVEPYSVNNSGLLQIAEMTKWGLSVQIDGDSGWNPGRTLMILISESANTPVIPKLEPSAAQAKAKL